jgi:hypothetical protein
MIQVQAPDSNWEKWQQDIVDLLRHDFGSALQLTTLEDVDWPAWMPYFMQGRSARQAIERALERDI